MKQKKLLKKGEIGVFALGGLGEVGKNTYVFEINDKLFVVDAGIMFPDDYLLGIDYVIPNYQYLIENEKRIVGLFVTHGHEDHIGGIPYLLRQVNIPKIYASGFAVDLIEHKLLEQKTNYSPPIVEFKAHHKFQFDDVEISFVRLNHSIPDMFGINFKTPLGNIFHTGDFKIDFTPVGPHAELDKLADLGREGVLCLLSDSTNALIPGSTPSESFIGDAIYEIFQKIKGRIIIATFASNIYRMQQIVQASYISGRKIAVVGRSMEKAMEIGIETGYIKAPKHVFIKNEEIDNFEPHQITILSTGSQGEPMSALSRIASGIHKLIKVKPNDTVIFSSSPIPGNQESINKIIDLLYRKNVEVIINGPVADTHTSGHGAQNDLMLMLAITKPKFFIPMHGEHRMLKKHRDLANNMGIKENNILIMDNGEVAAISKDEIKLVGKVTAGDIYIDGLGIGSTGTKLIKERKLLSEDGLLSIILTVDESGELIKKPTFISRGFIYMKTSEAFINDIQNKAAEIYTTSKTLLYPKQKIKTLLEEELLLFVHETTQRKPMIIPSIIQI